MRPHILALLLVLVLSTPLVTYGETASQQPRHTPGFPGSIYDEDLLREILNLLSQRQEWGAGEIPMDQFNPPETGQPGTGLQDQVLPSFSDISIPNTELPGLSSVSIPSLPAPQVPSIALPDPWLTALLVATILGIVLIAYFRESITSTVSSGLKTFSTSLKRGKGSLRIDSAEPIVLYWLGVEHVSRETGLSRSGTETHREYLSKVSGRLDVLKKNVFAKLTECYELWRFAHDKRIEIVEQARDSYNALVGSSES